MNVDLFANDPLLRRAAEVRGNAYAPYSGYAVGAAIEDAEGDLWAGANVENIAFGSTICAERAALVHMISEGRREIARVGVVTRDGGTPCGACLQMLFEFTANPHHVPVRVANEEGEVAEYTLAELMPHNFKTNDLGKA